jgi:drug/metabolite transporter (DMT)-like permease
MEPFGIFIALLGVTSNSLRDVFSKKLAVKVNSFLSSLATYLYSLPFYVLLLTPTLLLGIERITLTLTFLTFILLRSSTDVIGETMKMKAYSHGELSLVAAFLSFTPIFTMLISVIFLHERITLLGVAGVLLSVLGSFLVVLDFKNLKSNFKIQLPLKAMLLAFGASFFFSLNSIYDKFAIQTGTPIYTAFMLSLIGSTFLTLPNILMKNDFAKMKQEKKYFLIRGIFETIYMILKMVALQYISAIYMTVILRLGVLFSVFNGKLFLSEKGFVRKLIGAIILIIGLVVTLIWGK